MGVSIKKFGVDGLLIVHCLLMEFRIGIDCYITGLGGIIQKREIGIRKSKKKLSQ
jgi:hypothetical protein